MCVRSANRSGRNPSGVGRVSTWWNLLSFVALAFLIPSAVAEEKAPAANAELVVRMIGATTLVTEMSTGVPLPARVDTGATCCSIHCAKFEIKDATEDPKTNIGKLVRFLIQPLDGEDKGKWV